MSDPQSIPSGLLLIDKPADGRITSTTVCRAVKRRLLAGGLTDPNRRRGLRVGHAGTLDPLASGLLIILVGKATRLCNHLMNGEKTYDAIIDLSRSSSTDDLEGEQVDNTTAIAAAGPPSRDRIEAVLAGFLGVIQQRPPAYSAMWVKGERSYHLARAGRAVELELRPVQVHSISVRAYVYPNLQIRVRCGKGTYIRSLARDIGIASTGCAGCLIPARTSWSN